MSYLKFTPQYLLPGKISSGFYEFPDPKKMKRAICLFPAEGAVDIGFLAPNGCR